MHTVPLTQFPDSFSFTPLLALLGENRMKKQQRRHRLWLPQRIWNVNWLRAASGAQWDTKILCPDPVACSFTAVGHTHTHRCRWSRSRRPRPSQSQSFSRRQLQPQLESGVCSLVCIARIASAFLCCFCCIFVGVVLVACICNSFLYLVPRICGT